VLCLSVVPSHVMRESFVLYRRTMISYFEFVLIESGIRVDDCVADCVVSVLSLAAGFVHILLLHMSECANLIVQLHSRTFNQSRCSAVHIRPLVF
jgi:hypothetical protein